MSREFRNEFFFAEFFEHVKENEKEGHIRGTREKRNVHRILARKHEQKKRHVRPMSITSDSDQR